MRLWSLHPKYLDRQGLLALWREGLLAQKVLTGRTKGYKKHPQLERFKNSRDPVSAIGAYLFSIFQEAKARGFDFCLDKISKRSGYRCRSIKISSGQLKFEFKHLLKKIKIRDRSLYLKLKFGENVVVNPVFTVVSGQKESWEKTLDKESP